MPNVTIALPEPWIMVDVADLASDRLAALPAEATAVRDLLAETATRLAERQVGFLALRVLATEDGPAPTGLITVTLERSDATDLAEVERRVREEFADVERWVLGDREHIVGVSADAEGSSFVRGDFRLVEDGLLLTMWSTITVMDELVNEHQVLDIVVGNLNLSGLDGDD